MPLSRFSRCFACLLLALAASAHAQQPLPAGTPLQSLPSLPGVPGPLPATANSADAERPTVLLSFPNSPIADVLHYYEQLSAKHVIYDSTVQGQINLIVNTRVTRTEAIHLIESTLNLNGFALIPTEGDVVKVIGISKQPRDFGIPIYYDLADVPDTEQLVTFLVHLHYLEPQETSGMLQQYIPPIATVAFTPLVKAGAILITDSGRSVRRLVKFINQIDLPASPVTEKYFTLQRADATKAVEFLNNLFETKNAGGSAGAAGGTGAAALPGLANARRPIRRVGDDTTPAEAAVTVGPNGALSLSGDSIIYGRITLTPDVRTNRVYVVTSPVNLPLIESLLKEYDADTPFATPVRRALQFVSAKDVLPILVQALTEPGSDASGNGTTPGATNPSKNGQNANSNNSFNSSSNNNSNGGSFNGSSSGSSGSSSVGQSELDTQPVDTTPTEQTVGNTKLIADQRNNTIIVLGSQDAEEKIFEVLNQLDVRTPQVIIRTVIGELSLTDDHEFGLNYLLRSNRGSLLSQFNANQLPGTTTATGTTTTTTGTTTGTTSAQDSTASALNTFTTLATGAASGFSGVGGIISIGKSFDVILSALENTSRFKTVSRPMIFTQNNKKALIASGQEIAVPTSQLGTTSGSVGNTVGTYTNVDYKSVTLQLEVVPLINSKNEVTLDIYQQIDSLVTGSNTVVNGTSIPTIATRKLRNTVSAPNNSTIVLGGLITQDQNDSNNDIPYLNRIPILGKLLFSSRTRDHDRSELIILMHPEVVNTNPEQFYARDKEEAKTYLGKGLENQLDPVEVRRAFPVKTTVQAKKTTTTTVLLPTGK